MWIPYCTSCTITSDLKWGPHINNICNKANSTIGFLKRNLNIANKSVQERAYQSLVRPSLEYSSAVWDPHQQQDKQCLERIQRRAARYVTNRYHNTSSVSDMLDQLEWRRQALKASRFGAPTLASFRAFQSLVVLG
jgi:hypothetical protein